MDLAPSGQLIITAQGDLLGPDTPENRDLARRIRACINACDGLTTSDLEQGLIRDLCQVIHSLGPLLESQRRQLEAHAA